MSELVGGPVVTEAGALAQGAERSTHVGHGEGGAVAAAEDEPVGVVEAEEFLLFTVAGERCDQEGVKTDGAFAAVGLGCRLSDVLVVDFEGAFGDVDRGIVALEGDVGPAESGEFAGPEAAHESGEPHGGAGIGWDGVGEQHLGLFDGEALALFRGADGGEEDVGGGIGLGAAFALGVLQGLVEVVPVPVDGARRVAASGHRREEFLEPLGGGLVDSELTDHRHDRGAEELAGVRDRVCRLRASVASLASRSDVRAAGVEPGLDRLGERRSLRPDRIRQFALRPERHEGIEIGLSIGLHRPLDLAPRPIGKANPRHPALLRLVPPHRRSLGQRSPPT